MNLSLQVFQVREAFQIAYTTPAVDIRDDNGSLFLLPPNPPVMISAVVGEVQFIRVANANVGYNVFRRIGSNAYTLIGSVAPGVAGSIATFDSVDIIANSFYRVTAVNDEGPSSPSNAMKTDGPDFQIILTGATDVDHVVLNWTESLTAIRYEVTCAYDRNFTDIFINADDVGNVLTRDVLAGEGWDSTRPMWAKVQAFDEFDEGTWSNTVTIFLEATVVITPNPLIAGSLGTPYSHGYSCNFFFIHQTWSITDGALPSGLTLNPTTGVVSGTPTSTLDTGGFTVTVTDGIHTGSLVTNLEILGAPAVPVIVLSDEQVHQFTVTWGAASGSEDQFILEVATDSGFSSLVASYDPMTLAVTPTTVDVTGLTANTLYYVRLASKNTVSTVQSAWSNVASTSTLPEAAISQPVDVLGNGPFHDTPSRNWPSYAFTTVAGYGLTQLDMRFGRFGSESGFLRAHIYASASGTPTGSSLGSSSNTANIGTFDNVGYPAGSTDFSFVFSSPITLAPATEYCIVIEPVTFGGVAYSIRGASALGKKIVCSPDGITWGSYTYTTYQFYFVSHD